MAADEQRLAAEYGAVPSRQLADSLSLAAGRIAGALTAGQAADKHDLGVLAQIPVVLTTRAYRTAALADPLPPPPAAAPTVTVPNLTTPAEPDKPSRDDPTSMPPRHPRRTEAPRDNATSASAEAAVKVTTAPPAGPARRNSPQTSRDDSTPLLPTWDTSAIKPVPQRLSKSRAQAVIDAAELIRASDYRESRTWILRSGDTLIGYVAPSYGGASRSGRNGWISRLGSTPGPRCHSRDEAKLDLAARWLRVVTAAPRR